MLQQFIAGKTLDEYLKDPLLQSGVERQFEIIAEAISQLAKVDSAAVQQITDYKKIISFRNILIHGYAEVDDLLVWDIVATRLPVLFQEIKKMISAAS
ncbi:MAG TPA: DUF86 domain-containing protein [Steroidobacteraceae bacterium]